MRKKWSPPPADPRYCSTVFDQNAFEGNQGDDLIIVDGILDLANGILSILLPYSIQDEIKHENTPKGVKQRAARLIYTNKVSVTPDERQRLDILRKLLRGNAQSDKHDADAFHIFEAAKYGARYFITYDKRILRKSDELYKLLNVRSVVPKEFLAIYNNFVNRGY